MFRKSKPLGMKAKRRNRDIEPDEIFIDSSNVSGFDTDQFEGRIEKPISQTTVYIVGVLFAIIGLTFVSQTLRLQFFQNGFWKQKAENNRLNQSLVFAERGVIEDRNGVLLAWNQTDPNQADYALRFYRPTLGTHNLIGYVKYPRKDKSGFYYNMKYAGVDGIEQYFDDLLQGEAGLKLTETDVKGNVMYESVRRPPVDGVNIQLTIDARLQEAMYGAIDELAHRSGFVGGAGMVMDIHTGEVLASVSYPEYDSNVMAAGTSTELIKGYLADSRKLFLDRVSHGVYAPGSIVKPVLAIAALNENVITPDKQIESTGELHVPNPYKPGEYTVFKDWRANGWTDMRKAIAVSSDIYFYEIGGGFPGQKGLGIQKIDEYAKNFGLGVAIKKGFFEGKAGVIPTPEWKAKNFNGDIWRVGDTYNTAIGQYGFQVTPVQAIRAIAAIANGGTVVSPRIFKQINKKEDNMAKVMADDADNAGGNRAVADAIRENQRKDALGGGKNLTANVLDAATGILNGTKDEDIQYEETVDGTWRVNISDPHYFDIVREGMRMTVTEGTMGALNVPYVKVAGKTGTAQVGLSKQTINSWAVGFFPYDNPKYAFMLLLEQGPSTAMFGASPAMAEFVGKVNLYAPEYFSD
jgi:penicillin-binding protein 2